MREITCLGNSGNESENTTVHCFLQHKTSLLYSTLEVKRKVRLFLPGDIFTRSSCIFLLHFPIFEGAEEASSAWLRYVLCHGKILQCNCSSLSPWGGGEDIRGEVIFFQYSSKHKKEKAFGLIQTALVVEFRRKSVQLFKAPFKHYSTPPLSPP